MQGLFGMQCHLLLHGYGGDGKTGAIAVILSRNGLAHRGGNCISASGCLSVCLRRGGQAMVRQRRVLPCLHRRILLAVARNLAVLIATASFAWIALPAGAQAATTAVAKP